MLTNDDFEDIESSYDIQKLFPRSSNGIISILFNDDLSPVREVISRSNQRATGKWPSWKMNTVRYESDNEKNAFKLLDATPEVISYYPQPCIINYQLDGKSRTHYPDILVKYHDRIELWEVKTRSDAESPEIMQRSLFMNHHLVTYGYQYRVAIGEALKKSPRLQNVEKIIRLGREKVSYQSRETIRQLFLKQENIPWSAFNTHLQLPINKFHISRLILEGRLVCDVSEPINPLTLISMNLMKGGEL